jgi:hypothetical protein
MRLRAIGFGVPLSNRILKALTSEVQDGFYFLWRHVEHFRDFRERHTGFQIFEYGLNGHAGSSENPSTAYFAGNAFYGRTLGPIESWHS